MYIIIYICTLKPVESNHWDGPGGLNHLIIFETDQSCIQ